MTQIRAVFLVLPILAALAVAALARIQELELATLIAAFCAFSVIAVAWLRNGLLHPLTLTLTVSAAYILAGPVEVIVFGEDTFLSAAPMGRILVYGMAFLVAASISSQATYRWKGRAALALLPEAGLSHWEVPTVLAIVGSILVAISVSGSYGWQIGQIERAELYANEQALLSAARIVNAVLVVIAYAAIRSSGIRNGPLPWGFFLAVALSLASELLILGDRRLVISMVLGLSCVHGVRRPPLRVLFAGFLGVAMLFAYGFVRNRPIDDWMATWSSVDAIEMLRPSNLEFGGFLVVAEHMLSSDLFDERYPGYMSALLQVVPRAVLPWRPEAPSEWFILTYYPELAALGYGFGFNAIVESVQNLGAIGPVVLGVLTGWILTSAAWSRLGAGLAAFLAVFMMRLDLASLLRTALIAALAVGLVVVTRSAVADLTASSKARHAKRVAE